jgi:hypothetical protein
MADSEVDYSAELPPIARQGPRPTCVAFASTAGHEALRGLTDELSKEFLHWAAKQIDGRPPGGTTLEAAANALAQDGEPLESLWPYDSRRDETDPGYGPSSDACADAATRRLPLGQPVLPTYDSVRAAVDRVAGPFVLIGVEIHDGWWSVGADGLIDHRPGPGLGGHALVVAGYREVAGNHHLLIRNSWGDAWGKAGYAFLSAADFDEHAISAWNLVAP